MGSILLVEADSETSDLWAAAVSAAGHSVLIAGAIGDALPMIREGGIDLVVIDSFDPRGGVVELARSIEALPDAPPLVLISASPHAPELSARIGAAVFLAKPCEPADIVSTINRLLGALRPVLVVDDEPTSPNHATRHLS